MIPERENKFQSTKWRHEIENMIETAVEILPFGSETGKDIDEYDNENVEFDIEEQVKAITEKIMLGTDEIGLTLFIANKRVKFRFGFSQEVKYKKFLLLSTIIGLSCLSIKGTFVIKVMLTYNKLTLTFRFMI